MDPRRAGDGPLDPPPRNGLTLGPGGATGAATLTDPVIDLDRPVPAAIGPGTRSPRRLGPGSRIALLAVFALAAGAPQSPPALLSHGHTVPLPSYCTGTPIPGGRLNIIQGDTFIILDATTNTIVNSGRCPHGTGK